jgi:hypothetical protein
MWEDVMYNVVKVVDLVRHFSASCQRHGLCDEATFPQNFIGIIKEVEKFVSSFFDETPPSMPVLIFFFLTVTASL